jgi:hypothetical protein
MSATPLVNALRRHREGLASRWCKRFADNRAVASTHDVCLAESLVVALVEEVIGLLASQGRSDIPRRHRGRAFAEMAPFPENVAICIDCFQAGAQVIGAFVVEHAGPFALWSVRDRNTFLGELDAVFHILVHREIEAVCEHRLENPFQTTPSGRPARDPVVLRGLPSIIAAQN